MDSNPVLSLSLKVEEMKTQTQIEERTCEDSGRKEPSTQQRERPQKT